MVVHGSAHITDDLDICCRRAPADLHQAADALAPLHPRPRGEPVSWPPGFDAEAPRISPDLAFVTDFGPVDLFGEVGGVGGYDDVLAASEEVEMLGLEVRVLSLEGLIASKKAANRIRFQNHLLELEALKKLRDAGPQGA